MWVTHHVYYKAPDWLGPLVSAELGVPYVIAEASHAPKRAGGRWELGHAAATQAIGHADLVLCATHHDMVSVEPLVFDRERLVRLPPFLDPAPFRDAAGMRAVYREEIAEALGLDPDVAWIVVAEPMQPGDTVASYRALTAALAHLRDLAWRIVIAGDGSARSAIEAQIETALPGRACFVGKLSPAELAPVYAACDVCVWPAENETYARSMYEAQAAGIAIVTCAPRGVPDSVVEGRTGVRVRPGDPYALAQAMRLLLADSAGRAQMGRAAMAFIQDERSVEAIALRLARVFARAFAGSESPPGG